MPKPPLTRVRARNCFLANQFATPGMGSLMAGRRLAGSGQVLIAVGGFVYFCVGFVRVCLETYQNFRNETDAGLPSSRMMLTGMAIFSVAWVWALFTSFSLRREAAANEPESKGG